MWESAVDYLNTEHEPANPVQLIPAGQGMARLYDAIEAGEVPDNMWWIETRASLMDGMWQRDDNRFTATIAAYSPDYNLVTVEDGEIRGPTVFYRLQGYGPFDWE